MQWCHIPFRWSHLHKEDTFICLSLIYLIIILLITQPGWPITITNLKSLVHHWSYISYPSKIYYCKVAFCNPFVTPSSNNVIRWTTFWRYLYVLKGNCLNKLFSMQCYRRYTTWTFRYTLFKDKGRVKMVYTLPLVASLTRIFFESVFHPLCEWLLC